MNITALGRFGHAAQQLLHFCFRKRFFASFSGSSRGAVRTVFLSIAHRTTVDSSTRKRGTRSSKSNISGKPPSNSLITMPVGGDAAGTVSRNNLKDERRAVINELLEGSNSGKLAHGGIKRVAQQFGCSTKQVSAVWRQYKSQKDAGIAAPSLRNNRAGNSGRKGVDLEELREKLKQIPMKNRTTLRSVAAQLEILCTTLADNLKKLSMCSSRRYLKPLHTDGGKAASHGSRGSSEILGS